MIMELSHADILDREEKNAVLYSKVIWLSTKTLAKNHWVIKATPTNREDYLSGLVTVRMF